MPDLIAEEAEQILRDLGMWRLPVDPLRIAEEEGIELAPSLYGRGFDARIEYYRDDDKFAIYYQHAGVYRSQGRVRFSLAHELGHFYLPDHRAKLRTGYRHNSVTDFASKNPLESEADRFAASLLMPKALFIAEVGRFHSGFCTLKDLCELAERLMTSVTSTAIRYCDCDIEATTVVLSRDGIVLWSWPSEDMRRLGMWFVKGGNPIPATSHTANLLAKRAAGGADDYIEGHVDSDIWFDWPKRPRIWEEAMFLGDRVLTYLAKADS